MSHKLFRLFSLVMIAVLLLTACAPAATQTQQPAASEPTQPPAAEPTKPPAQEPPSLPPLRKRW